MDKETLTAQVIAATKARDKVRLSILRQVSGEVKQIEVDERREVTSADVDAMIKRVLKQTGETLAFSIEAGTDDERTARLTQQVAILEGCLPRQVSGDELAALIDEVLAETGASTKRDMGTVMAALGARTGGNFDKAGAARVVGARLA
jgi:uncharacterized protein